MKFRIQRQLTLAIENRLGCLAALARAMAARGINIKDLCVIDNVEQGVIRMVPSDPALAKEVLAQEGLYVIEAEVLILDVTDTPGKLARLAQVLADAEINIEYAYGSEDPNERKMRIVIKVSNSAKACEVLKKFQES